MFFELPNDVPNHGGELVNGNFQFFGEPPAEIGTLLSAQSNMKKGGKRVTIATRLIRAAIVLLIFFIIATVLGILVSQPYLIDEKPLSPSFFKTFFDKSGAFYVIISGIVAPIVAIVVFLKGKQACTYVGTNGTYQIDSGKSSGKLFTFDSAEALLTARTEQFYNGVYNGTNYNYSWVNEKRKRVHTIAGQYRQKQGIPKKLNDPFYFSDSASYSWNNYKYTLMLAQLKNGEVISFNAGGTVVNMGLETFSIIHKKKQLDWDVSDIEDVQVQQGFVNIYNSKHTNMGFFAKMFGQGKVSFAYSTMPNAEIFLMLMNILLGKTAPEQ